MVINKRSIDAERIFLLGGSGGGHMALMVAVMPRYAGEGSAPGCRLPTWRHGTKKMPTMHRMSPPA
jgi:acetyl esterase/lipase